MKILSKTFLNSLFANLLILFFFIFITELLFGYWFDKDNLGPYMREHRMKNESMIYNYEGETHHFNYRRNYYGFRGDDIEPSDIKAIILGGSVIDDQFKPEKFTITGYLNKNLKEKNYDIHFVNAGIPGQSTIGMIYNFKNWFPRLKNFSPKIILLYVGLNDAGLEVYPRFDPNIAKIGADGHVKNPEKFEFFLDNIKSRSFFYDSLRIFKFKYLPKKNFVKYDGSINPDLKENFKYINYQTAIKTYNIEEQKEIWNDEIVGYLSRIDTLYKSAKKINSNPIFITSIGSKGLIDKHFILNYTLIAHCKKKKYRYIDVANKLEGKYNYWTDGGHTTKIGNEVIANLIIEDLEKFIKEIL